MLAGATTALAQESTPELAWHDTQGNTQSINQYRGKILLLNFWATWCIPCQHEMPMLEDMQRKYGEKGLIVLGDRWTMQALSLTSSRLQRKTRFLFPCWSEQPPNK